VKNKNIFLYLALACFLGIVLIFVFDGYIGVYDTIEITTVDYRQEIEPDFWLRDGNNWWLQVEWNGEVHFTYEVDNRRFSGYTSDLEVSAWYGEEKISILLAEQVSIGAFNNWQTEWVVDTSALLPPDASSERGYQFTIIIIRGNIERRIIINMIAEPLPPVPKVMRQI
jgi:hypothetical protein